ncbi:MAG: class I SAM-dependent methyltransferase [Gemmatimonadetes bacterium]|nr:class I SAM-dependent methyltransferase [Gemmatimonadota bacterium]
MSYHRRSDCRGCGNEALHPFLELGPTPLANAFLRSAAEFADEAAYPLDVVFCPRCSLVQILDVVDPEVLFRDYIYVTGTSSTIAAHNRAYAKTVAEVLELRPGDRVVEVASNDGSLLRCFADLEMDVLGVEPASNIAAMANESGISTVNRFFGHHEAQALRKSHGPARAVIGNNVLAHVDDTLGFLRGFRALIDDDGLAILEVPYLGEFLERLEYDTVYHEHLCYFSIRALMHLCGEAGLRLVRADFVPVHGGSVRIYAAADPEGIGHAAAILELAEGETAAGFGAPATYDRFAADVAAQRTELREMLASLVAEGRSLAAYGAPAKGNTLLNYCGVGTDWIPWTVDRNPLKVGLFTPGAHIPVLPVETLLERQPDVVLILAWNFAEEIMEQQEAYRRAGGRFLIPVPRPRLV